MKGINVRRNKNGFLIAEVHYTANPDKTEAWRQQAIKGYPKSKWAREMEISWETGEGDPVYPRFNKEEHTDWLKYDPRYPVYVGWDFGRRRPAVVWLQNNKEDERINVLSEYVPKGIIFDTLINDVIKINREKYKGAEFINCVDPYGGVQKGDKSLASNIEMMSVRGLAPRWQRTNIETRVKKVEKLLDPNYNNSKVGIKIDRSCKLLIACMNGGLVLEDKDRPLKDKKYEDIHDAFCYAIDNIKFLSMWDEQKDRESTERFSSIGRPLY